ARLEDLRAELEEAEQFADIGRAERLRVEVDHLVAQLAGHFRARPSLRGPAETARKAVTKVLRTQLGKLFDAHPALARHLRDAVRMGTICVYAPPTRVEWDIGLGAGLEAEEEDGLRRSSSSGRWRPAGLDGTVPTRRAPTLR